VYKEYYSEINVSANVYVLLDQEQSNEMHKFQFGTGCISV